MPNLRSLALAVPVVVAAAAAAQAPLLDDHRPVWRRDLKGDAYRDPLPLAVAGDLAVLCLDRAVLGVELDSGVQRWRCGFGDVGAPGGPAGMTCVDGSVVLAFTTGHLLVLDAATGVVDVTVAPPAPSPVDLNHRPRAPCAGDGLAFVEEGDALRAVGLAEGRTAWRRDLQGVVVAGPVFEDGVVTVAVGSRLTVLAARDGALLGETNTHEPIQRPLRCRAGVAFFATARHQLVSWAPGEGAARWRQPWGHPLRSGALQLAVHDQRVLAWAEDRLLVLDTERGTVAWRLRTRTPIESVSLLARHATVICAGNWGYDGSRVEVHALSTVDGRPVRPPTRAVVASPVVEAGEERLVMVQRIAKRPALLCHGPAPAAATARGVRRTRLRELAAQVLAGKLAGRAEVRGAVEELEQGADLAAAIIAEALLAKAAHGESPGAAVLVGALERLGAPGAAALRSIAAEPKLDPAIRSQAFARLWRADRAVAQKLAPACAAADAWLLRSSVYTAMLADPGGFDVALARGALADRSDYVRNAALALLSTKTAAQLEPLAGDLVAQLAREKETTCRMSLVRALAKLDRETLAAASDQLRALLDAERAPEVRSEAKVLRLKLTGPQGIAALEAETFDRDLRRRRPISERVAALRALLGHGPDAAKRRAGYAARLADWSETIEQRWGKLGRSERAAADQLRGLYEAAYDHIVAIAGDAMVEEIGRKHPGVDVGAMLLLAGERALVDALVAELARAR